MSAEDEFEERERKRLDRQLKRLHGLADTDIGELRRELASLPRADLEAQLLHHLLVRAALRQAEKLRDDLNDEGAGW